MSRLGRLKMLKDLENKGISEILLYVADPFNSHEELTKDGLEVVRTTLEKKFEEGYSLLDKFRKDCIGCCYDPEQFREVEVSTRYELLENIMKERPGLLVDMLRKYYRLYVDKRPGRRRKPDSKLSEYENKIKELSMHTHEWRQQVEKYHRGPTEFDHLKKIELGKNDLYFIGNPNINYPNYPIYSTFQRQKTAQRIVEKLLRKIIKEKTYSGDNEELFNGRNCIIDDFFGLRIIGLDWNVKDKIDKFVFYPPYVPEEERPWVVSGTKNNRAEEIEGINYFKYDVRWRNLKTLKIHMENIELQYTTLVYFLLDEFFNFYNHIRYESAQRRRNIEYQKREDYAMMSERLNGALDFLP